MNMNIVYLICPIGENATMPGPEIQLAAKVRVNWCGHMAERARHCEPTLSGSALGRAQADVKTHLLFLFDFISTVLCSLNRP